MNTQDKQERNIRGLFIVYIVLGVVECLVGGAFLVLGYYVVPQATMPLWKYGQLLLIRSTLNVIVLAYLLLQFKKVVARLKGAAK